MEFETASLDDALEKCCLVLEGATETSLSQLYARFPQWRSELSEFVDDWLMLGRVSRLSDADSDFVDLPIDFPKESSQFADCYLEQIIGVGAMGVVFRGSHPSIRRQVAIKIARDPGGSDLIKEADLLSACAHPHVMPVYAKGTFREYDYFCMPLARGGNLRTWLDQGCVTADESRRILLSLAGAVRSAHGRGILHQDLKPANVLMTRKGQPLLADFGLASGTRHSRDQTVISGTPGYMAPEQIIDSMDPVSAAVDVYGLGAILYTLLTTKPPFNGGSSLETLRQVVEEPLVRPSEVQWGINGKLEAICLKCLEKDPKERYESVAALVDDLSGLT